MVTAAMKLKRCLLLGRKAMTNSDSILKSRNITLPTKVRLVKAMVFPVVMDGCESWTVKKAEHRRIDAFELWCWRRLLTVPWTAARQASLSIPISRSLLKLMSLELVMASNHFTSVTCLSSCLQSFPASGSFPMSQFLASGGQSIGV